MQALAHTLMHRAWASSGHGLIYLVSQLQLDSTHSTPKTLSLHSTLRLSWSIWLYVFMFQLLLLQVPLVMCMSATPSPLFIILGSQM